METKKRSNFSHGCHRVFSFLNGSGVIPELFRFGLIGALATATHYGVYLIALKFMSVNVSYSIGYVVSLVLNYYLSVIFTFKSRASIKRGVGFTLSHLINYGVHFTLLNLFIHLNVPPYLAPFPVFAVAIPVNFIFVRFVFTSKFFR